MASSGELERLIKTANPNQLGSLRSKIIGEEMHGIPIWNETTQKDPRNGASRIRGTYLFVIGGANPEKEKENGSISIIDARERFNEDIYLISERIGKKPKTQRYLYVAEYDTSNLPEELSFWKGKNSPINSSHVRADIDSLIIVHENEMATVIDGNKPKEMDACEAIKHKMMPNNFPSHTFNLALLPKYAREAQITYKVEETTKLVGKKTKLLDRYHNFLVPREYLKV